MGEWDGQRNFAPYTDLTLGSGFANLSSSEKTQAILANGMVTVFLAATKASFASGDVIATLPAGMLPPTSATRTRIRMTGQFNGAIRNASVLTDGSGQIVADGAQTLGVLGTVTFPVGT